MRPGWMHPFRPRLLDALAGYDRPRLLADVGASARTTTTTAIRLSGPRIALGLALVLLGVFGALASQGDLLASLRGLAAALLAVLGLALDGVGERGREVILVVDRSELGPRLKRAAEAHDDDAFRRMVAFLPFVEADDDLVSDQRRRFHVLAGQRRI